MPCVKSDRGGAVGTSPDLLRSQSCDVRAHLFAHCSRLWATGCNNAGTAAIGPRSHISGGDMGARLESRYNWRKFRKIERLR